MWYSQDGLLFCNNLYFILFLIFFLVLFRFTNIIVTVPPYGRHRNATVFSWGILPTDTENEALVRLHQFSTGFSKFSENKNNEFHQNHLNGAITRTQSRLKLNALGWLQLVPRCDQPPQITSQSVVKHCEADSSKTVPSTTCLTCSMYLLLGWPQLQSLPCISHIS